MSFTDVLKKSFPFISAAASLGGPVGTMAASLVGKAIGVDKVPATSDGISSAIAVALADPTQRAALLQAEQQFQLQMSELGYKSAEELSATDAADRASARNREISLKDKVPAILAFLVTLGFFGVLAFMLFRSVPSAAHDALLLLLGSLSTAWTAVVTYYYGSSAGSDRKTELLANGNQK
jgi:NH3-dependent NAD+ synthetase